MLCVTITLYLNVSEWQGSNLRPPPSKGGNLPTDIHPEIKKAPNISEWSFLLLNIVFLTKHNIPIPCCCKGVAVVVYVELYFSCRKDTNNISKNNKKSKNKYNMVFKVI